VVLDASAVVRALRPGDPSAVDWIRAVERRDVRAVVPDLIYVETAHALLGYVKRGEITTASADAGMERLLDLPLDPCPLRILGRQALGVALLRKLSAYDACYLALAIGYDAVLVTADRRLAAEAEKAALLPRDHPPAG
jgi:predicted nucleic acid-binding protein